MKSATATTVLLLLASAHRVAAFDHLHRNGTGFIVGMVVLGVGVLALLGWCLFACCIGASSRRRRGTLPRFYPQRAAPGVTETGPPISTTARILGPKGPVTPRGTHPAPPQPALATTGAPPFPQPVHQHGANVV
ncbi:hypothetical protein EXIGLDRAFT_759405 [Exidia glandulosa HHB12029]|uniref:Uncharacterized protein n=1 Tax=Exidia glandulosa HHB12029 TaxID=1314781 RepID=A0A165Q554_EXIGL|nr:hypothetical protein EXIGLDRAFT_759405 [Exidia glandulosa HHB12029]